MGVCLIWKLRILWWGLEFVIWSWAEGPASFLNESSWMGLCFVWKSMILWWVFGFVIWSWAFGTAVFLNRSSWMGSCLVLQYSFDKASEIVILPGQCSKCPPFALVQKVIWRRVWCIFSAWLWQDIRNPGLARPGLQSVPPFAIVWKVICRGVWCIFSAWFWQDFKNAGLARPGL